jgi:hypothetical protein
MAVIASFYDVQAAECATAASLAQLPMLREKYERAGAAWMALALRERQIETARLAGKIEISLIAE